MSREKKKKEKKKGQESITLKVQGMQFKTRWFWRSTQRSARQESMKLPFQRSTRWLTTQESKAKLLLRLAARKAAATEAQEAVYDTTDGLKSCHRLCGAGTWPPTVRILDLHGPDGDGSGGVDGGTEG